MSDRPFELQSRDEKILAAIIDGTEYTDVPQSRIEYLLLELKAAIEAGSSDSPIKYKGSKANIAALPTVSETPEGYMYTLISGGTTTSDFVEGSGHTIPDGENVVAVNTGTEETPVMKWDTLGGITDGLQPLITMLNKLSADLVDDSNSTHKFVTAAEKAQIATNTRDIADAIYAIGNAESKIFDLAEDLGTKQAALVVGTNLDAVPTENSTDPITSGGVYAVVGNINIVLEEVL